MKTLETKAVVCRFCNGEGKVSQSEPVDHHNNIRKEWNVLCVRCLGTGLLKVVTTTEVSPFIQDHTDAKPFGWKPK